VTTPIDLLGKKGGVIAGLDPAIHLVSQGLFFQMDARVKPAQDGVPES